MSPTEGRKSHRGAAGPTEGPRVAPRGRGSHRGAAGLTEGPRVRLRGRGRTEGRGTEWGSADCPRGRFAPTECSDPQQRDTGGPTDSGLELAQTSLKAWCALALGLCQTLTPW